MKKIIKINKIRKLQLKKIKDFADKKEINKYFSEIILYEHTAIKDKLETCTGKKFPELNDDFDGNIEKILIQEKIKEQIIIDGDYSYNFCVFFKLN